MKGENWGRDRIKSDIRIILTTELEGTLSKDKIEDLIIDCGDDMSAMAFVISKYKYHTKIDEAFSFNSYINSNQTDLNFSEADAIRTMSFLSVFEYFGLYNEFNENLEVLSKKILKLEKKIINEIIDFFIEREIIQKKGDFIKLIDYRYYFFSNWLKSQSEINIEELIEFLEVTKSSLAFSKGIVNLCDKIHASSFINQLSSDEGLFQESKFLNSAVGAQLLYNLVELDNREELLNALFKLIDETEITDLKDDFVAGRRYTVWALEKLVYRSKLFGKASELLFKLGLAENERMSNNATGQFVQLFQIHLGGTSATLNQRIDLLKQLKEKYSEHLKDDIFLSALDTGLSVRGFFRSGGAEKQVDEEFQDYSPKSIEEVFNYYEFIIKLLLELGEHDLLIKNFSSQYLRGNRKGIINAITTTLDEENSLSLELRQQFQYVLREVEKGSEESEEIQQILNKYSAKDLVGQLNEKVILAPYSNQKDEHGNWIDVSANRAKNFAIEIGKKDEWLPHVSVLLQGEQRFTFSFGEGIAEVKPNDIQIIEKAIQELEVIDEKERNVIFFNGYLNHTEDDDFVRQVIDLFLKNEDIAFYAIRFNLFINHTLKDIKKLYPVIAKKPHFVEALSFLKKSALKEGEFIDFMKWLKEVPGHGIWKVVDLCYGQFDRSSELNSNQQEFLQDILLNDGMLVDFEHQTQFSLFEYVDLVRLLYKNGLKKSEIEFITREVLLAVEKIEFGDRNYLGELLGIFFEKDFEVVWPIIVDSIVEIDYKAWWNLKDILSKYQSFQDAVLLQSMDDYPEKLPQRVIDFIKFEESNEEGEPKWSYLALEMIKRYHSNEVFLDYLSSRLHSYTITGYAHQLLKDRKTLVTSLLELNIAPITEFANKQINYFDREIEREKRSGENDQIRFS